MDHSVLICTLVGAGVGSDLYLFLFGAEYGAGGGLLVEEEEESVGVGEVVGLSVFDGVPGIGVVYFGLVLGV